MEGLGLTVTVTVNVAPGHGPVGEVGVTVYVAVCTVFVGFVNVPVILVAFVPDAPPVIPPVTVGDDHVYVVPLGTISPPKLEGVTVNVPPEQMVDVLLDMIGLGLTYAITVNGVPEQDAAKGVMVYVTLPVVGVLLFNV